MEKAYTVSDAWSHLRQHTQARIAQGRSGHSLTTDALLRFQADHALARDAVYSALDLDKLLHQCLALTSQCPVAFRHAEVLQLHSQAANRQEYLQRPDKGRRLRPDNLDLLHTPQASDLCIVLADGLSATAINSHADAVLSLLVPALAELSWSLAPLCLVEQGRVAIADEIAAGLGAQISLILIGERPGLSSPDSMGAYLTFGPVVGLTDERRNCVSNIRPEGLPYEAAARKLLYLLSEAKRRQISGVLLKDQMLDALPSSGANQLAD